MAIYSDRQMGPFEGSERNPQGRLFKPAFSGNRMDVSSWLQSDAKDTVQWHHNRGDFPEYDSDMRMDDDTLDYDEQDRAVHKDLGYQQGMHFGTPSAGFDRWGGSVQTGDERKGYPELRSVQGHPVRLARSAMYEPPADATPDNNTKVARPEASDYDPSERQGRWTDKAANFSPKLQNAVERGKVIPYENRFEDEGSTSYKALRDTARTWSEDVEEAQRRSGWGEERVRPAEAAAVAAGYNPVLRSGERVANARQTQQPMFPGGDRAFTRAVPGEYATRREFPNSARDLEDDMMANPARYTEMRRPSFMP